MEPMQEKQNLLDTRTKESISWRVQSGFFSSDEIVEIVAYSITDESSGITLRRAKGSVRPVVAAEWAVQMERQGAWPDEPTVADKLAKAFGSLERNHKVLARMNFTCCQTCGMEEISEGRDEDTRGYVFFHEQDTEGVIRSGDLYLAFGSFTKSKKKNGDIGDTVVKSLRRAGLSVEWDKDMGSRIVVRCGEWRRRLIEDEDVEDIRDDDFDSDSASSSSDEADPEFDIQLVDELDTTRR